MLPALDGTKSRFFPGPSVGERVDRPRSHTDTRFTVDALLGNPEALTAASGMHGRLFDFRVVVIVVARLLLSLCITHAACHCGQVRKPLNQ